MSTHHAGSTAGHILLTCNDTPAVWFTYICVVVSYVPHEGCHQDMTKLEPKRQLLYQTTTPGAGRKLFTFDKVHLVYTSN